MNTMRGTLATAVAAALLATGCASPRVDGQWSDPGFANRTLRDTKVLVSCRGPDTTLARICEDRLVDALREAGAQPVRAPQPVEPAGGNEAVTRAARAAGASASVSSVISVAAVVSPSGGFGPSVGFGIGGGSGGIGIGGSFSVPLGGVRAPTSFGSGTVLLDAETGREMWSIRATNPGREDASTQVAALARTTVESMRGSGLFEKR
jgi:hypothetical protein